MDWELIVAAIAVIFTIGINIYTFLGLPASKQIEAVKEWCKLAVVQAEAEFGSSTGVLKLRSCYEKFSEKFPWIAKFISFETFSAWIDDALEWMENQLASNSAVAKIVYGETTETTE